MDKTNTIVFSDIQVDGEAMPAPLSYRKRAHGAEFENLTAFCLSIPFPAFASPFQKSKNPALPLPCGVYGEHLSSHAIDAFYPCLRFAAEKNPPISAPQFYSVESPVHTALLNGNGRSVPQVIF